MEKEGPREIAVDFTHAKSISDTSQVTHISGTDQGQPVSGLQPIGDYIDAFEMSHGHNFLTLNGMHRQSEGKDNDVWAYFGDGVDGVGLAIPRVEAEIHGETTREYQVAGPALQSFVGLIYDPFRWAGIFAEYKLTYTDLEMDLNDGGTISTETYVKRFIVGFTVRF